jgi:nitric oxide reductase subunit B
MNRRRLGWLKAGRILFIIRHSSFRNFLQTVLLNWRELSVLRARLEREMRANTYDPATERLTISTLRAEAIEKLTAHYADVFAAGRSEYAIPSGALTDSDKARRMGAFFFWTSWVASTNRPGESVSYTQNWPHEPLVGNNVTGSSIV